MDIYETNTSFEFKNLLLSKPTISQGGNYFIRFSINGNNLYIRPPKAIIKQQSIKNTKKSYCDIQFSQENETFIQWMENLENYSQKQIFENRSTWFESELELDDIENSFISPMKSYKSGKFYIVRTNITPRLGKISLKIYDENEKDISLEDLSENSHIESILEVQGIKCSAKSFQIEIELKQMMVLNNNDLFETYILKPRNKEDLGKLIIEKKEEPIEEPIQEEEFEKQEAIQQEEIEKEELEEQHEIKISSENQNELCEVEFNLEEMSENDTITLKKRDDVYYEMYKKARRKAKIAKDLALSAYLEAKEIKNKYMLSDISDSDNSDIENDS
jgi:hypothetical protein